MVVNVELNIPDIYLLVIDTLSTRHITHSGKYSRILTPHIYDLTKDGEVFLEVMSCSNHTYPCFASLLSGKYPSKIGMKITSMMPLKERTLPLFLRSIDYNTINISHICKDNNLFKDFEVNIQLPWRKNRCIPGTNLLNTILSKLNSRFANFIEYLNYVARIYDVIATSSGEKIFRELGRLYTGKPVMALIHFPDLHSPYHPPHKFWRQSVSFQEYLNVKRFNLNHWNNAINSKLLDESSKIILKRLYECEVRYVDELIGKFINYLKNTGKYEDSLILLTADHGESFGAHNLLGHWHILYEDILHIPLVIKWPKSKRRGVNKSLVQPVDILPTILDYVGIPCGDDLSGLTFYSKDIPQDRIGMAEQLDSPGDVYRSRERYAEWNKQMPEFNYKAIALRQKNYKFISYSNGNVELFNLGEDPDEVYDISKQNSTLLKYFNTTLQDLYNSGVLVRYWSFSEKERIRRRIEDLKPKWKA